MPLKILTIKKSTQFRQISQNCKKFHAKSLILLTAKTSEFYFQDEKSGKNAEEFCRVGFTASKKIGNAIKRNKAKRRLREAARELLPQLAKNHQDYIIIAKNSINGSNYKKILSDLKFCLKRIDDVS